MKIKVSSEVILVTPEQAAEWLAKPWPKQRLMHESKVEEYVRYILEKKFRITPDAILIMKGLLANGQHRLTAVVRTGLAQTFIVMYSNDEELYKVLDAGCPRTVADNLIGLEWARALPAIGRWIFAYENLQINQGKGTYSSRVDSKKMSRIELIDYCNKNSDLLTGAVSFTHPLYRQSMLLPLSIGSALHVLSTMYNRADKIEDFLRQLYVDGGTSAAMDLRNRLIANRGSKAKLPPGYVFGITIKAFSAFCNGVRTPSLKWAKTEEMPRL